MWLLIVMRHLFLVDCRIRLARKRLRPFILNVIGFSTAMPAFEALHIPLTDLTEIVFALFIAQMLNYNFINQILNLLTKWAFSDE